MRVMGWWWLVWGWLDAPVNYAFSMLGLGPSPLLFPLAKVALLLLALFLLYLLVSDTWKRIKRLFESDSLLEDARVGEINQTKDKKFALSIEASRNLEGTVAALKRVKDYAHIGEAYAAVGKHKEAAKWFKKAKDLKRAAMSLAQAGETMKAAKLLMKQGDFATAARFFSEIKRFDKAALAFEKMGSMAFAAAAYAKAGKTALAVARFAEYFEAPRDPIEVQAHAADDCFALLQDPKAQSKIADEQRVALQAHVAARFEQSKRYDLAAQLYKTSGNMVRAGEVYLLAGKLREAAECMKAAGKMKEASQITARFYETSGQWREAAFAYTQAGDYLHAADCYARAADPVRAAECYEKANAFYRAGLAYAHAARFAEAIRTLQKVSERDPDFDASRPLLGRCFYELHDFAHCAAALENHLMGKKVDTANKEQFYMLGMAYEQLGKLGESRDILYKIRTVDVGFRDVAERISNISSRISMQASGSIPAAPMELAAGRAHAPGDDATKVMETVESSLGGRYRLERELGRGGMGVVFLARDTQLDRPVALKFLGSLIDNAPEFRERFIREARTAARITHPNIIGIYDISASVGKSYIAMEYVEGPSLYKYCQAKGKLSPRETISVVSQSCLALSALHEAGIVHRDIKPDNILVAKGGLVKLTDFGLAKAEDSRLTRTGMLMGTPSYMSPEQVLGKEADPRSDVYSLGLVMYECLTGQTVFRGDNVLERQLQEMPPPPSQVSQDVPAVLDGIVMRCIAKKPDERYAAMRELYDALKAVAL